jgi:hypothetical protein
MKSRTRTIRAKPKVKDRPVEHKAVPLVKLVGVTMRLKEHNNHLQGLYAELGKIVYDQQLLRSPNIARQRSAARAGLVDKITEMKRKMMRLEREARALKRTA